MDVAESHGMVIDVGALSASLGLPVVPLVGRKGKGREELKSALRQAAAEELTASRMVVQYGELEPAIARLEKALRDGTSGKGMYPIRWLAVRLLEQDEAAQQIVERSWAEPSAVLDLAREIRHEFELEMGVSAADHIMSQCYDLAQSMASSCLRSKSAKGQTLSERIDRVVLNRLPAPVFMVLTVFLIYQASIVQGYKLTEYTWPYLASMRNLVASWVPAPGLVEDPLLSSLILWMVDSANSLLNYVPIFFILFTLIAVIEDSGYMEGRHCQRAPGKGACSGLCRRRGQRRPGPGDGGPGDLHAGRRSLPLREEALLFLNAYCRHPTGSCNGARKGCGLSHPKLKGRFPQQYGMAVFQ